MKEKIKLVRVTTVPISLKVLLRQQLRFMSNHYDVLAIASPGDHLDEVQTVEGVRTTPVAMSRAITPLKDAKALWQLYKLFKKERPAIVHTHTPKAGLLGMLAGKMAGVPVRMHTVAGLPLMESRGLKRKVLTFVEWLTYRCATNVYPNSIHLSSFITTQKFCRPEKLKVLGNGSSNGIDTDYFQPDDKLSQTAEELRNSLKISQDDFVYIFVGRLVKDKGIEELIAAFRILKKTVGSVRLLLVGPFEPERDPLSTQILAEIRSSEDIIHVDFQQDVRPYFAISHALVFPSYREGFPNVPMQAGCFHLPSIVTNINGCNEIIQHGKNGLLVPPKDAAALKNAMELLVTNRSLYASLQENARKLISDRYEQKHFWKILLREYQEQLTAHVPQLS